ncbi:response regulator transcription factor [Vallitalea sp.]|jgi:YesN/AraC family two-component response regulator|uniref:response regulator transcription factor n=1 Tax=Vallitalea sp. TaxID=1882829 RepID=UPI0025DDF331|nr:response regulator [Vallitalea sp.]MCT4687126.1 response regulator [Vallitalea sp.]
MYSVYLLDDEPWALRGLISSFDWEKLGFYIAKHSTNPLEIFELAKKTPPDLIITDIRMPGMNGIELIKSLRKLEIPCDFIIVSGFADFSYAQKAIEYNVLNYILKPIDVEDTIPLLQKVHTDIDRKQKLKYYSSQISQSTNHYCNQQANEHFNAMIEYINSHFSSDDMNLQCMADKFCLNNTYICDLFKKTLSMTFNEYVTELRLKKACSLLSNTNLTVYEIAEQTGYKPYYFNTLFKKKYNSTPLKYRKENSR